MKKQKWKGLAKRAEGSLRSNARRINDTARGTPSGNWESRRVAPDR